MSEANANPSNPNPESQPNPAPPSSPAPTQQSQTASKPTEQEIKSSVDTAEIIKQVRDGLDLGTAVKEALASTFAPQEKKKEVNKIHKLFAERPEDFVAGVEELIRERIREEDAIKRRTAQEAKPIVDKYTQKYPQLRGMKASIEAEMADIMANDSNISAKDALEKSLKKHSEILESAGVKGRSDEDLMREQSLFPPTGGGGYSSAQGSSKPKTREEATADYIKNMREANQRFRKKAS